MSHPINGIEFGESDNNFRSSNLQQTFPPLDQQALAYQERLRNITNTNMPANRNLPPGASPTYYPPSHQPDHVSSSSSTMQQVHRPKNTLSTSVARRDEITAIYKEGRTYSADNLIDPRPILLKIDLLESNYLSQKMSQEEYCYQFAEILNTFIRENQDKFESNPHNTLAVLRLITIDPDNVRNSLDCLSHCDIDKLLQGAIFLKSTKDGKTTQKNKISTIRQTIETIECIITLSESEQKIAELSDQQKQTLNHLTNSLQEIYRKEWNRLLQEGEDLEGFLNFFEPRAQKLTFLLEPQYALETLHCMGQRKSYPYLLGYEWIQKLNLFETINNSENTEDTESLLKNITYLKARVHNSKKDSSLKPEAIRYLNAQEKGLFSVHERSQEPLGNSEELKRTEDTESPLKKRTHLKARVQNSKKDPSLKPEVIRYLNAQEKGLFPVRERSQEQLGNSEELKRLERITSSSSTEQQVCESEERTICESEERTINALDSIRNIFEQGNKAFYSAGPIDYKKFIQSIKKLESDYSSEKQIEYCTAFTQALNDFIKKNQEKFVNPYNILAILGLTMIDSHKVRNPLDCLSDCDIDKLLQGVISPEFRTVAEGNKRQMKICQEIIQMMECVIEFSENKFEELPPNDQQIQTLNLLRDRLQQIYRQELNRLIRKTKSRKEDPQEKNLYEFFEERASKITSLKNPEHAFKVLKSLNQRFARIDYLQHQWMQDLDLFKTISESENEGYKKAVARMIPAFQHRIESLGHIPKHETECLIEYLDQKQSEFPPLEGTKNPKTSTKMLSQELARLKKQKTGEQAPKDKKNVSLRRDILGIVCDKGNSENPLDTLKKFPDNQLTYIFEGLEKEKIEHLKKIIDKVDHLIENEELSLTSEHQALYNQTVVEIEESHAAENEIYNFDEEQQVPYSNQTDTFFDDIPPDTFFGDIPSDIPLDDIPLDTFFGDIPSDIPLDDIPSLSFDSYFLPPNAFVASSSSQPQNVTPLLSETQNNGQPSKKRKRGKE